MKRIFRIKYLILCLVLVACSDASENEVLKELKALRGEVAQLREAFTDIHRVAIRPGGNKPAPSVSATNVKVSLDDDPVLGDNQAKIGIVEFSDFQCPFCARFHSQTFPRLKMAFIDSGEIKYVIKDYPLGFHSQAKGAAIVANCAAAQDNYWSMKASLLNNQRRLGEALYKELVQLYKLDAVKFEACRAHADQAQEVDEDFAYGQSLAVRGTPHFFVGRIENNQLVNAKRVSGAQPFSVFAKIIESL